MEINRPSFWGWWGEIHELLLVNKNLVFTAKMIAYNFFGTYKYRLHLQKKLVGFTNSNIYSGVSGKKKSQAEHGIVEIIADLLQGYRNESVSLYFFKEMISVLEPLGVPVYYLPPPVNSSHMGRSKNIKATILHLNELQLQFDNLRVLGDSYQELPEVYFRDDVHLNPKGLTIYRHSVLEDMLKIISNATILQQDLLRISFLNGTEVVNCNSGNSYDGIKSLNEAVIQMKEGKLFIQAQGDDPALLVAKNITVPKGSEQILVVKISLDSKINTISKLYYSNNEQPFSEKRRIKKQLHVGHNELFFTLPDNFVQGKLRFDPGEKKGIYIIKTIIGCAIDGSKQNKI